MYEVIFYGGLALSILFLGTSIYFYKKNDVPRLLESLTGHRIRKRKWERNKVFAQEKKIRPDRKAERVGNARQSGNVERAQNVEQAGNVTVRLKVSGETKVLPVTETLPLPGLFDVIEDITVYYMEEKDKTGGIN